MFLTRKHLSRRTLLKGVGASLALPLLDAMIPAATALAQTAAARKLRVGFFYFPHGAIMDRWTPSGSGAAFNLNVITKSLDPYKKYVTSFGNLKNDAVGATQHVHNQATWLSGVQPSIPGPRMSATLDQVIAGQIAQDTPVPSLELSSETSVHSVRAVPAILTAHCPSATRQRRCRWNSIHELSSLGCSVPRTAMRFPNTQRACSIFLPSRRVPFSAIWVRATAPHSIVT